MTLDQLDAMKVPDTMEQSAKSALRLRELAPKYQMKVDQSKRAASDAKDLRQELTYHFAIYKAIHVGKGRDGNWKNFVENELGLKTRTVDRWVADRVKLASGELPAWVVARLKDNMDPEPEEQQETKERPLELKLVGLTDEEKIAFNEAMDQFQPDVVSRIIFVAVTTHPALAKAAEPKPVKERVALLEGEMYVPTIAADLEQRATIEATA